MSEETEKTVSYLQSILGGFCVHPPKITSSVDEKGLLLTVEPSKLDTPCVIGKKGITANALRVIMRLYAQKEGDKVISLVVAGKKKEIV